MKISNQRLRNLTTKKLHTDIQFIYEDLEMIVGEKGIMTHMLPNMNRSVEPWLRSHVSDARFWDGEYDPSHDGETELPEPTKEDREAMIGRYYSMPSPFA